MDARSENLLDEILSAIADHHSAEHARLTAPHHPSRRDLSLFGLPVDEDVLAAVQGCDSVEKVSPGKEGRLSIRLDEAALTGLGERLESGDAGAMETADLNPGKRVAVDFCDPNATKALHIGHLRNLSLGNAVASILRASGADVLTQSQVGDVGRSIGEAMAGYLEFAEGQSPESRGQKSDHFVGDCYSRYVQDVVATEDESAALRASDPALSREEVKRDDLASRLIARWHEDDPEARELWLTVRDWAIAGQEETFARLGIGFDCLLFESEFLDEIDRVGDELVARGIADEAPSGAVLYATGDSNYPHLVLRRPDGHSTQHLRYIALWDATREQLSPGESIEVMGDEWLPLAEYGERILDRLDRGLALHPTACMLHGMVTAGDAVVKSSLTAPLLIDELLDQAIEDPAVAVAAAGSRERSERLAAIAVLGCCLGDPPSKRLPLSREALFDPVRNAGWALAAAALTAWDPGFDGEPNPDATDRDYRFVIAQSQVHRQLTRRSGEELNPVHLARFHSHLSRWFLQADPSPRLARAMRTVSSVGLRSLGLPSVVEPSRPLERAAA